MKLIKQLLVALVIASLLEGWWSCDGCFENERNALLQLKASFNYPERMSLSSWGLYTDDCCKWENIHCNSTTGRVSKLSIRGDYWASEWCFNASLFLPFQELTSLSLQRNYVIDCVENEGFERLERLNKLEFLDLKGNLFNNESIVSSIGHLSPLKSLNLAHNRLESVTDIQGLSSLQNLEFLDLSFNIFKSDIQGLSGLENLEFLDLSFNNFTDSIIPFLRIFPSLKSLNLAGNRLESGIQGLSGLENLEFLDLSDNNFDKSIIPLLSVFSSLKSLTLIGNKLENITDFQELDALGNLKVLSLGGNQITKVVDSRDVKIIRNLSSLFLDDINWDGRSSIQLELLGAYPFLKTLSLMHKSFKGGIFAQEMGNFSSVEELSLDGSSLDEESFKSLRALPSLKFLSMKGLNADLPSQVLGLCELKHLQKLDMSNNDLSGTLPLCLANLTSLQLLDLSSNHFIGNISLSPLGTLTSMHTLHLSRNLFQIPISLLPFFNLSKLKHLDCYENEIYADIDVPTLTPKFQLRTLALSGQGDGGVFPKFFYYQHELEYVDMSNIKMKGEFPHWLIRNNTKLYALYLHNSSLSGPLQLPIHSHVYFSDLDISDNHFNGSIPTEIGVCFPSLNFLNLSGNGLTGGIPSSFGKMSQLTELDLSKNQLSGIIPQDLIVGCNLLGYLILSNNNLQGQIFPKQATCELILLLLDGNQFTGSIPYSISNCTGLAVLDVSDNHLFGIIPSWIGNITSLNILDLSENTFFGNLPSSFVPPRISEVYLSKNRLQGPLTNAFYGCSELIILDLSHNDFTKRIPEWIGNFSTLTYLLLGYNRLEGEIPIQLCHLFKLRLVDFSNNNLSGEIPVEIGNLDKILLLNLSHNKLTGLIPQSFSNLTQIESLDLSYNNLNGKIPQLTQLYSLAVFSVAHNNLSGKTPDMVAQFGTFENRSYEGNPFLCGPPLSKSCSSSSIMPRVSEEDRKDHKKDGGFIDMYAFYVSFMISYAIMLLTMAAVLYINPHWRRAWFYMIELSLSNFYYFLVDNIPFVFRCY
ncbi:cuscuta receptor 1-like [Hevea brasiliensis]|uniref:cuscuta receptor 1-like n=1 Tax=Hevea brasiliensis TaxID=3981 RepID=UPI0025D95DE3|nr:cuscuta receptor 1-like [Hevea brasiliensis]